MLPQNWFWECLWGNRLGLKHLPRKLQPKKGNREDSFIAKRKELKIVAPAGIEDKFVGRKIVTHD